MTPAAGGRWQPRLVALDIDGTLLRWLEDSGRTSEEIGPAVRAAVHRALDAGAHVVLTSGRSAGGMTPVADLLGPRGRDGDRSWLVASNGAVVLRYPPVEIVHEETFDAAQAVREVLAALPGALVAVEERGVGYKVNRPFPEGELNGEMLESTLDELVGDPVSRVIIRDPDSTPDALLEVVRGLGMQGTDYVVGWTAWMDLQPRGVSKASGLAHVAERLGVARADVLAIGDGHNDVEMLRWAGRGVAMGQAVAAVRAAADAVTGAVDDDGVAAELGRWFA